MSEAAARRDISGLVSEGIGVILFGIILMYMIIAFRKIKGKSKGRAWICVLFIVSIIINQFCFMRICVCGLPMNSIPVRLFAFLVINFQWIYAIRVIKTSKVDNRQWVILIGIILFEILMIAVLSIVFPAKHDLVEVSILYK